MSAVSMHLVTGYAGSGHIRSEDWARLNEGIFGKKNYVLDEGNKFSYEKTTSNQLKINPGEAVVGGRHVRFVENVPAILDFVNASQGATRTDSIVIRLRYNDDGTEEAELDIVTGTKVIDSDYSDISSSHKEKTMVIYHVTIGASGITKVEQAFVVTKNMNDASDGYVKPEDYATNTKGGTVKVGVSYGTNISDGFLTGSKITEEHYKLSGDATIICKGTLENIKESLVNGVIVPVDVPISWASGENPTDNSFVKKHNHIVNISYQGQTKAHTTTSDTNLLGTITNSADRPKVQTFIPFVVPNSPYAYGTVAINKDGTIRVSSISNATLSGRIVFNGSWIVN